MCKCDGMEASNILPGQQALFTAFAKVEGQDVNNAKVESIQFFLGEGDAQTAKIIAKSDQIPVKTISSTTSKIQYKADWKQLIPEKPKPGAIYRAWAQIKCTQKTQALNSTPERVVLAAETEENRGFFSRFFSFFGTLFGGEDSPDQTQPEEQPNTSIESEDDRKSLQLEPIYPAQITEKSCKTVRFKFEDLQ
jgi:hypothetical protein